MSLSHVVTPNVGTFTLKKLSIPVSEVKTRSQSKTAGGYLEHTSDTNLKEKTLEGPFYLAGAGQRRHGKYCHRYTSEAELIILLDKDNVQKLLDLMGEESESGQALIFKTKATVKEGTVQAVGQKVGTDGTLDANLANWFVKNQDKLGGAAGWFAQLDYDEYMFINPAQDLTFVSVELS